MKNIYTTIASQICKKNILKIGFLSMFLLYYSLDLFAQTPEDDYSQVEITVSDPISPTVVVPLTLTVEGCSPSDITDVNANYAYSTTPVDITDIVAFNNLAGYTATDTSNNIKTLQYYDVQEVGVSCPIQVKRIFTIEDACGNQASATQTISVQNTSPLTITCLADQNRIIPPGPTTYTTIGTEFDYASTSGSCSSPTITNNLNNSSTLAGYEFTSKITDVTWTATDECGRVASCTFTVTLQSAEIALVKRGVYDTDTGKITYVFEVTNTSDITVNNVSITDTRISPTNVGPFTSIAPGDTVSATYEYTVTPQDFIDGKVTNTAVATGKDDLGNTVSDTSGTGTDNDNPTVTTLETGDIALVKTSSYDSTTNKVTYTFTVSNISKVTVENVKINDTKIGVTDLSVGVAPDYKIAPGATVSVTYDYTVTQPDLDAGTVTNTAIATGTDVLGNPVSDTSGTGTDNDDPTVTTLGETGAIALVKTSSYDSASNMVTYVFEVTNTSDVTVENVKINDTTIGVTDLSVGVAPDYKIAPGATVSVTYDYMVTQTDLDAGTVTNTALATGKDVLGNTVSDTSGTGTDNDNPTVTTILQEPSITLTKKAIETTYASIDDVINYTINVKNTGNITLYNINVTDPNADTNSIVYKSGDDGDAILQVGEEWTYSAYHTVTQSDIDNRFIENTATVMSNDPKDNPVTDSNDIPVRVSVVKLTEDQQMTPEDTPVVVSVLDNDLFDPNSNVEVIGVSDPDNGTVVINPDGTVTYTPYPDFTGTDTFTYTVSVLNPDGTMVTETITVTIDVTPVADAVNDSATTFEDTPVVVPVLNNDLFDPSSDVKVTDVSDPDNGIVVINPDGTITYTPDTDFNGTDSFTYTVTVYNADGTTTTETATVTVTVTPVADTGDDSTTTLEDTPVEVPIYDNDNDIPTDGTLTVTQPDNGTVVIDDGGTPDDPSDDVITYIPDEDYNGTDTFTYTVCDTAGNCDTATVTITVTPTPDAEDDTVTIDVNNPIDVPIYDNDNDIPTEGTLTVTQPDNGTVEVDDNGTPDDPSDDIVTYIPDPYFTGDDIFTYTICDVDGNCSEATVEVHVLGPDYNFIPNAFSPGNDGENDTWVIPILYDYPNFSLEVYNRWGNLVYDYHNNGRLEPIWWDGRSTGRLSFQEDKFLPTGTYYYIIYFNDGVKEPVQDWLYLVNNK